MGPWVALGNVVDKKKRMYAPKCEDNGYKFIPFNFSTFGEFDTEAFDTLSRIKSIVISHLNNGKSGVLIFHRISYCQRKEWEHSLCLDSHPTSCKSLWF